MARAYTEHGVEVVTVGFSVYIYSPGGLRKLHSCTTRRSSDRPVADQVVVNSPNLLQGSTACLDHGVEDDTAGFPANAYPPNCFQNNLHSTAEESFHRPLADQVVVKAPDLLQGATACLDHRS